MAITKMSNSGIASYGSEKYNDMLAGNAPYIPTSFESIATFTAAGGETSLTFSSIPSTYSSLQIRIAAISTRYSSMTMYFNNNSSSGAYSDVGMYGRENSSAGVWRNTSQNYFSLSYAANYPASPKPWLGVIDIFNYSSAYKTAIKGQVGGANNTTAGANGVELTNGLWNSTDVVSRIDILSSSALQAGSIVALYGIM
jgi:hypothetical protein